jgi:hypothetical protein
MARGLGFGAVSPRTRVAHRRPATRPWALHFVDKSPIIINVLTGPTRGLMSPPGEGERPEVSGYCLVRRKGRASFRSSLGSSGNQYSCGFELIQR